jgi:hypothetical protein
VLGYGGPEEGGWWFGSGTLARLHRVMRDEAMAHAYAARANRLLDRLQRYRRPVSSAAYDGGRYRMLVFCGNPPPAFPAERPIYN